MGLSGSVIEQAGHSAKNGAPVPIPETGGYISIYFQRHHWSNKRKKLKTQDGVGRTELGMRSSDSAEFGAKF